MGLIKQLQDLLSGRIFNTLIHHREQLALEKESAISRRLEGLTKEMLTMSQKQSDLQKQLDAGRPMPRAWSSTAARRARPKPQAQPPQPPSTTTRRRKAAAWTRPLSTRVRAVKAQPTGPKREHSPRPRRRPKPKERQAATRRRTRQRRRAGRRKVLASAAPLTTVKALQPQGLLKSWAVHLTRWAVLL
jgi:hypothetical protein